MRINKILIILIVLFLNSSIFLFSQTLRQQDFENLINNHPLMKNYDKKTGYFRKTNYDNTADLKQIRLENASITKELENIKSRKEMFEKQLISEGSNEDDVWSSINNLDKKEEELLKKIEKNNEILVSLGSPDIVKLINITDRITEDSILPLFDKNRIVLNKLPRYVPEMPEINDNDLRRFFYNSDDETLKNYLKFSYAVGLLFNKSDNTIIYDTKNSKGNVALVNLSKILALHPKMALFDFNRMGFYKVKKCNLSEDEFDEEIFNIKSSVSNDNISKLEKEIENIDRHIKIIEEKFDDNELESKLYNQRTELIKKLEEALYSQNNNDITDLNETRKILDDIEKEVLSVIADYSKTNNYEFVLNTSIPRLDIYTQGDSEKSGKLANLMSQSELYYFLFSDFDYNSILQKQKNTIRFFNWLTLVKNPIIKDIVFVENIPLVIYGGENIETSIINKIYSNYSIKESVTAKIHLYKEEVKE